MVLWLNEVKARKVANEITIIITKSSTTVYSYLVCTLQACFCLHAGFNAYRYRDICQM